MEKVAPISESSLKQGGGMFAETQEL